MRTIREPSDSVTVRAYRYPHDSEVGVVAQQHLPDDLATRRYYEPTNHGQERDVQARLEKIRRIIGGT